MKKIKDFLIYKDLRRLDELKTKYKILLLSCFAFTYVFLGILFGFNKGIFGAGIYGVFAGYLGKGLFFLITIVFGRSQDLYYSK